MGKVLARLGLGGLLVILAAFVIGCGGDDDSSSGDDSTTAAETSTGDTTTTAEEPEVTQEDFVKEADNLCKTKTDEIAKVLTESDKAQAAATTDKTLASEKLVEVAANKVADLTDELADLKNGVTKQLAELEAPDQKELDQLVKSREAAAKDLNDLADTWRAYGQNPTQATVDDITAAQKANVKSSAADRNTAEKIGLKVCGAAIKPA